MRKIFLQEQGYERCIYIYKYLFHFIPELIDYDKVKDLLE